MMNQYKLGVGPMSLEIIDVIIGYPNKDKLMVVASRNQVDYIGGYVCDPYQLALKIKPAGILLCRDHCGPYFKDSDRNLSVSDAVVACMKTINADLSAGFDLIHIDISKIEDPKFEIAKSLLDYALSINPNVLFEFGSEENTGHGVLESVARITPQLEFIKQYTSVKYFVSQTGSLTKNRQAGTFEVGPNTVLANTIHNYNLLFKEHNADYLQPEDIAKRSIAGVDAMNIAPQLGFIQTCIIEAKAKGTPEWIAFSEMVYKGNLWRRWVDDGVTDIETAVRAGAHYHYNSPEYKILIASLTPVGGIMLELKDALYTLFDSYLGINIKNGDSL